MRVFPDTNVLASAFGSRGLCSDVIRLVTAEHELVIGEVVIGELRRVLRKKFAMPGDFVDEIEGFLRGYYVEPKPAKVPELKIRDRDDLLVLATAVAAGADFFITGDKELLALTIRLGNLKIASPRDFWTLASTGLRR